MKRSPPRHVSPAVPEQEGHEPVCAGFDDPAHPVGHLGTLVLKHIVVRSWWFRSEGASASANSSQCRKQVACPANFRLDAKERRRGWFCWACGC
eukprot:5807227-Amphidinium_carterae.1